MDEIAEWLDEIVEDVRGSDSDVESLLEDIVPVKAAPTRLHTRRHQKTTLGTKPRGKSPREDADALLESIRTYKKQSLRTKPSHGNPPPGKSPREDADALLESIRTYKKQSGGIKDSLARLSKSLFSSLKTLVAPHVLADNGARIKPLTKESRNATMLRHKKSLQQPRNRSDRNNKAHRKKMGDNKPSIGMIQFNTAFGGM